MVLIDLIITILGIYLVYKFVFEFVVPIYNASKKVHQQFRGMNDRMNADTKQRPNNYASGTGKTTTTSATSKPRPNAKDYIDFEEIK
jgi:hypothetical protein